MTSIQKQCSTHARKIVTASREQLRAAFGPVYPILHTRQSLFGEHAEEYDDSVLAHPGFVGRDYRRGGTLFLGMAPGAGIPDATEARALSNLARARGKNIVTAHEGLCANVRGLMLGWKLWLNCASYIVEARGDLTYDSIAYVSVLPWRVRDTPSGSSYAPAWVHYTAAQVAAHKPGRVVVLGSALHGWLSASRRLWSAVGDVPVRPQPRQRGDGASAEVQAHAKALARDAEFWR